MSEPHTFDLVPDTDHCRSCGHGRLASQHDDRPLSAIPPEEMTEEQMEQEMAFWERMGQIEREAAGDA